MPENQSLFDYIAHKFMNITVLDVVDIVLIAFLLYCLYLFLKRNNASVVFVIMPAALIVGMLCIELKLTMAAEFFRYLCSAFLLLIVVIFGMELKRDIWKINSGKGDFHLNKEGVSEEDLQSSVAEVVKAVQNLAKNDVGALIVFAQKNVPSHIIESGVVLNAEISAQLIETIFIDKAPMHDGAIVIHDNKIVAAGCFLPLSQEINIPKELGTRHRAAIGITEAEDVVSVVVSEETGVISTCVSGKLKRYVDGLMLTDLLYRLYGLNPMGDEMKPSYKRR